MSIAEVLRKYLDEHDHEAIDGRKVSSLVDAVDLEIAGVPLCVEHECEDWQFNCPQVTRYERWENPPRWALVRPESHDFEIVSEETLKRMRARFLLMNGWYYRHFHTLTHSMRSNVFRSFLSHTQCQPPDPDSQLGKMLGIAGATQEAA
jgi:hypothetical protein